MIGISVMKELKRSCNAYCREYKVSIRTLPFKCQTQKMVKQTETNRRQLAEEFFDFVVLALKQLTINQLMLNL